MRSHILVVDDDPYMTKMLVFLLTDFGYQTSVLSDPSAVRSFLSEHTVNLILLDVMLPYIDGFTLCTTLRREHPDVPIVFLSARGLVGDKVDGFNRGADDFISKPFEPTEMLARIQAVLRRYRRAERNLFGMVIKVGDTALDLGELQFKAPNRPPALLTPTEMKILECLMRNADAVISRETLIERTWGYDYEGGGNRINVYIGRIRQKIEVDPEMPRFLQTVRGYGYVFRDGHSVATELIRDQDSGRHRTVAR